MIEWTKGAPETPEEEAIMVQIEELYVKQRHKPKIYETERGWRTTIEGRRLVQRKSYAKMIHFLYQYYYMKENPPEDPEPVKQTTIAEMIEDFICHKETVYKIDQATATRNRYSARFFDGIGSRAIDDITADEIRVYIGGQTFKEYEIKAALQLLKGAFKWYAGKGLISQDPAYSVEAREFFQQADRAKKTAEQKILLPLEIEKVKAAMRRELPNMRAFGVLLSIETGMRAGELVTLKWSDIQDGCLWIHTQQRLVLDADGKRQGFEELPYTKDERKHPHDGRLFPITDEIRAILRDIEAVTGGDTTYILEERGEWITKTSYEKYLKRHMKALGFDITNNHAFRMSLNSNVLIPAGLSPAERAYILGHSIETNERYYSHTRKEQAADIGTKLRHAKGHANVMQDFQEPRKMGV